MSKFVENANAHSAGGPGFKGTGLYGDAGMTNLYGEFPSDGMAGAAGAILYGTSRIDAAPSDPMTYDELPEPSVGDYQGYSAKPRIGAGYQDPTPAANSMSNFDEFDEAYEEFDTPTGRGAGYTSYHGDYDAVDTKRPDAQHSTYEDVSET